MEVRLPGVWFGQIVRPLCAWTDRASAVCVDRPTDRATAACAAWTDHARSCDRCVCGPADRLTAVFVDRPIV